MFQLTQYVDSGDLNSGDRRLNSSIFGNVIYSFNKNTEVGLELTRWETERKNESEADIWQVQTSFMYKF